MRLLRGHLHRPFTVWCSTYSLYLNCRLAVCFKLFIICVCNLLFAFNYLRLRFATGILGGNTTGAPEADSVATKMAPDGETAKAISGM